MVLSGFTFFGITYFLPLSQGIFLEFYYLDVIAFALTATVGIILTRRLMRMCFEWDQDQSLENSEDLGKGKSKSIEVKGHPATSRTNTEEEGGSERDCWGDFLFMSNVFLKVFLALGCESLWMRQF